MKIKALAGTTESIGNIRTVSLAYDRWRMSRQKLQSIRQHLYHDKEASDLFILSHPEINPQGYFEFQKLVVQTYHEWFQKVVIGLRHWTKERGLGTEFHVYSRWNLDDQAPLLEFEPGNIYWSNIIFDALAPVPAMGMRQCLVLVHQEKQTFRRFYVPVDYVEKVEGLTILPPKRA